MRDINDENECIAKALEGLIWPNMAIGNKVIIKAAIEALRKEREKAEPIVYMNRFTGRAFELEQQPGADKDPDVYIPLYTAPPAPVVPDELVSELLDIAKRAAEEADECANAEFSDNSMKHASEIAEWERRAEMLNQK